MILLTSIFQIRFAVALALQGRLSMSLTVHQGVVTGSVPGTSGLYLTTSTNLQISMFWQAAGTKSLTGAVPTSDSKQQL